MTEWGRKRYITPGVAIGGELISTDLVEINLMIRILLGSSYFDGWENEPTFVDPRPARQPGRQEPSVEQGHAAASAEARLHRQVHVGRVAADLRQAHRHTRLLRHRRRPVRAPVVHGQGRARRLRLRQGDRSLDPDGAAALAEHARDGARVERAGEVQRDRARSRPHLPPGLQRADRAAQPGARDEGGAGRPDQELEQLQGSGDRGQLRLPRGGPRRALAPHGDPRREDRQLPALSRRRRGTPARATSTGLRDPTRTRCRTRRSSRRTGPRTSRASTSCARCDRSIPACRAACTCTRAAAGSAR